MVGGSTLQVLIRNILIWGDSVLCFLSLTTVRLKSSDYALEIHPTSCPSGLALLSMMIRRFGGGNLQMLVGNIQIWGDSIIFLPPTRLRWDRKAAVKVNIDFTCVHVVGNLELKSFGKEVIKSCASWRKVRSTRILSEVRKGSGLSSKSTTEPTPFNLQRASSESTNSNSQLSLRNFSLLHKRYLFLPF